MAAFSLDSVSFRKSGLLLLSVDSCLVTFTTLILISKSQTVFCPSGVIVTLITADVPAHNAGLLNTQSVHDGPTLMRQL